MADLAAAVALICLYLLLTVPALRALVRVANRAPCGWDYLLVVGCCLAWFVGWGMLGVVVMTWD